MTNEQRAIEALRELVRVIVKRHGVIHFLELERAHNEAIAALAAVDAVDAVPAEPPVQEPVESALTRFEANGETDDLSPLERLRFFCSLAMNGQDWLDVEPFFDALEPAEPVAYGYWNKRLGWYGLSLQPGGSYTEPDRRPLYADPPTPQRQPLTDEQIAACVIEAGCHGGAMRMIYESGPYEITRPTVNAVALTRAVERAHGIGGDE